MKKFIKSPLGVIFITVFIDLLGYGILIPVIPLLLTDPVSTYFLLPIGESVNKGYILLGFLIALFPLGQFIATPILGQLSDRFGRKRIILLSLIGTFFSYIFFAYGIIIKNIPLLFLARFFGGITGGTLSVAQAAIADVTKPEERARGFALVGAAFGLGFIIGPLIGAKLSDPNVLPWFDATTPFWFAAIVILINILLIYFIFPETKIGAEKFHKINFFQALSHIKKSLMLKDLRYMFLTNFFFQSGFSFFATFFSVFLLSKFAFTQTGIGNFFAFIGICVVLAQIFVTRPLTKIYSDYDILKWSLLGGALILPAFILPSVWQGIIILVPLYAIFNGLSQATTIAIVSKKSSDRHQGEVLGINSSLQALGQAIPPMFSGFIAASFSPAAPTIFAGLITGVAFIIFAILVKK